MGVDGHQDRAVTMAPYSGPLGSAAVTHRAAFILTEACGTSSA